jgi:aminoglycoside 3-N-acetyltransferase
MMSEADAIARSPSPRTTETLSIDLRALGLEAGITVLVHSSLSSLGWVNGGPVAVVQALIDVITPEGTIVMPTQSGISDPAGWQNPPVPESWWQVIRDTMPAYDSRTTPTRGMGQIVDTFRRFPGVMRSAHPSVSFAAWGRHAHQIIEHHSLDYGLGEESPLRRIYDLDGWVLLLGVGYGNNTSFHLAEYRVPGMPLIEQSAPVMEEGKRVWKTYRDIDVNADPFPELGADFERERSVRIGLVGSAQARLFSQRSAVDFAVRWLTNKKT